MEQQQRRTIVTGALLLSNIMAGMDGTIVNTALPAITSDLHGLQYMGWIIATFLLGMAVATPLWSKFGEHKGNKQAYIIATSMFLVGAIFQGLAPNILWFIIARTIMGIGAGGMNTIPFIVFAELYENLKKRAEVLGIASACFGTASIIGPLLGGWIVDALSWHWVFYVNVPIALVAITIVSLFYKNVRMQAAGKPVDYLGASLLVISLVMILVAVQLIGTTSGMVVAILMIIGLFLLGWMAKVDSKAADPIVPSRLFKNRELVIDFALFVIIWGSFIAFVTYIPMWAQGILGLSALLGGMTQIPGAVTNFIGSELVPVLQERWGKYWIVTCGAASIFIAYLGIMIGGQHTPFWLLLVMGAFEGFGVGLVFNILQINVQTDAELRDVPIATSLGYLLRILSQTLMSAVYGVILNQELFRGVQAHHDITLKMLNQLSNAKTAGNLPTTLLPTMRTILYSGYHNIIVAAVILIVIALVLVISLGWRNHCQQEAPTALDKFKEPESKSVIR
ncbi:MFS transporter [Limosilactobacillus sp. STM2_1]|uniref:MFS transporter n=1 Tax=Limosilactobacillus rudii TaxID=2759755 RepID=A0A7W3UMB0_9LACO|nr:MFS transporter [Limosilactobacillus rudii]MBB1078770.1 MFS transporter [Limosilactobacillus rudii]MBB1098202.1 MFS transporter [Limosilactobacillus rudii]MCD7135274.1 MFS transporter [Limosilactobacillus rudii]